MTITRAALYARVSTIDKDQDPETQLRMLREHCARLGWTPTREYVDHASAVDYRNRTAWRELVDARDYDVVLVLKIDRAWRSVLSMLNDLNEFDRRGVQFQAITQPIDTGSSHGRLTMQVLAAVAEFERELIRARTKEGMARAAAEGRSLGRPKGVKETRPRRRRGSAPAYPPRRRQDGR